MTEPKERVAGIYRLKLDVIVVADDLDTALEGIVFKAGAIQGRSLRGWEQITIRDTAGRVNPAWRVTEEDGGVVSVELKRRAAPTDTGARHE